MNLVNVAWLVGLAAFGAVPASALTQSWNGYHWARTGPLLIGLGDNVSSVWDPYLSVAAADWTRAKNIDFRLQAGTSSPATCAASYGNVQVCNANYGATGWLGIANVWASGGNHIVQATVKLNDYYFSQARYNTAAYRSFVTCQEVGHTLGLTHTNEVFTNLNTGSCMDYTNDPSGLRGTNGTLANTHPNSVDFAALNDNYNHLDTTQLSQTKARYLAAHAYGVDGKIEESVTSLVPEPASWTLMIAGFGLVGSSMRRRVALAA